MARKISTEVLDPSVLEPFVACRLIPLDKNPGVRPIGVGEVLRRIIGKCVGWVLKEDIQLAAGPLQTATGLQSGAEAAIHSMKTIFESDETDAVILVDASNAFNSLNRQAALHNTRILCPQISTILINTYRKPARLVILNSIDIPSLEGTTQGDNLAMAFYALGTTPLLDILKIKSTQISQVCLADDITGAGKLTNLKQWWNTVISEGKKYGYFVNEGKSWLIIKDERLLQYATELFADTKIKLTTEGQRHLGGAIGSLQFREQYASEKVAKWCEEINRLTEFSKTQPHAAYAAFTHGVLSKYTYFMRTIPTMCEYMKPLDDLITSHFLPTLLNEIISNADRNMYSLPVRKGGLGIPILTEIADDQYEASKSITLPLVAIMVTQGSTMPDKIEILKRKNDVRKNQEQKLAEKVTQVEQSQTPQTVKAMHDAQLPCASSWLSVLPIDEFGFALNKGEFRDAINLRYGRPLKHLPSTCPCGQKFDVTHALNCKKGGFITIRHNNIRNFEAGLLTQVVNDVEIEPNLQPLDGEIFQGLTGDAAKPDIRARGVWRDGQNAFFDVRVTNPHSASQCHLTTEKVLEKHEQEKKRNYNRRVMEVEHGTFTPLVFAVSGGMGKECSMFHRHVAEKIATKTGERYGKVICTIRCKLSFIILKSVLMCVRGSRSHTLKYIDEFEHVAHVAGLAVE